MEEIYNNNLYLLKGRHPYIHQLLMNKKDSMTYEMLKCADGNITLMVHSGERKLLLHSKYNPIVEAQRFAREKLATGLKINIVYGFGLGYHIIEMQKILDHESRVYVFDLNVDAFQEALKHNDLTDVLSDERLHLEITSDLGVLLKGMERVLAEGPNVNVILHLPSVQCIPDELEDFKFVLEDWNLRKSVDEKYGSLLYENFLSNSKIINRNVCELFEKFKDIPFIIVSAGPSLDKNIHLLKELNNRAFILSAGSAVKLLLDKGIKPHMFAVIDPQEIVTRQLAGIEDIGIPAVFLATASRWAVEMYKGHKFLAVQDKAYSNGLPKEYLVKTGGSVSTTCIDIALRMGANRIILVGQDLAYTENKHHAEGYVYKWNFREQKNMRTVKGQNGETLYTTLGFLSFKRWIENTIEDEKDIEFINASEGGAFIRGAKHLKLETVISEYLTENYDIQDKLDKILSK